MVALALIGIDVVLRCLMIEPNTKQKVVTIPRVVEDETEPLLRRASLADYQTRNSEQGRPFDEEGVSLSQSAPVDRIPPILRLAMSGQLLILLIASIVDAAIWTAFEAVRPFFSYSRISQC